jgi:hypothetical protein
MTTGRPATEMPAMVELPKRVTPGRVIFGVLADSVGNLAGQERTQGGALPGGDNFRLPDKVRVDLKRHVPVFIFHAVILARIYVQH